jgi:GT2 family glycosyltransferase
MHKNGLSIIILSWNTKDITDECLKHLKIAIESIRGKIDTEVILVDNSSSDGSPQMVEKKYPWVKLILSRTNLGYPKGNNLGFKNSNPRNKYLLLLNSDVYVEKDTLERSLAFFESKKDCKVFGCKLIRGDGSFQPSAGYLPTPLNIFSWFWGLDLIPVFNKLFKQFHPRNKDFFGSTKKVGWVQGAYLFMEREVFDKTNGFDEKFFMYMDEVEWSRRVQDLGYNIYYAPGFAVTHLDRASAHKDVEKLAKTYSLEVIGLIYYLRKYYPEKLGFLKPILKIGAYLRWFIFLILGNEMRKKAYSEVIKKI